MSNTDRYLEKNRKSRKIKQRRHWPVFEKLKVVEESKCSNTTICSVALKYGISPNQLSVWRRLEKQGKLKAFEAREEVVPVFAVQRLQTRIQTLEQILEKKSKEIEILRATKPGINDLEKYPHLRMAIKFNLLGDTAIWIKK